MSRILIEDAEPGEYLLIHSLEPTKLLFVLKVLEIEKDQFTFTVIWDHTESMPVPWTNTVKFNRVSQNYSFTKTNPKIIKLLYE